MCLKNEKYYIANDSWILISLYNPCFNDFFKNSCNFFIILTSVICLHYLCSRKVELKEKSQRLSPRILCAFFFSLYSLKTKRFCITIRVMHSSYFSKIASYFEMDILRHHFLLRQENQYFAHPHSNFICYTKNHRDIFSIKLLFY